MFGSGGSWVEITPVSRRQLPAPPSLPFLPVSPSNTVSPSASMPKKHEMATLTCQPRERRPARPTGNDRSRTHTAMCKPGGLLTRESAAENFLSVSGYEPGQYPTPVSHNPQRVEISERASAARGARQLRAKLLNPNLLPRLALTLRTFTFFVKKTRGLSRNAGLSPAEVDVRKLEAMELI